MTHTTDRTAGIKAATEYLERHRQPVPSGTRPLAVAAGFILTVAVVATSPYWMHGVLAAALALSGVEVAS